jgi:hypothetical protein
LEGKEIFWQTSGEPSREIAKPCLMNANTHSTFGRHHPRMRVIQYSRDAKVNSRCRGVLDRPVKPDDDRRCAPHKCHPDQAMPANAAAKAAGS